MEFSGLYLVNALWMAFSFFLYALLALNIFSLPANWIILGVIALLDFLWPFSPGLSFWQWAALIAIALLGEAAEILFQLYKAKKYGSSTSGTFASLVGAILGAILLSPVFWGLGALVGAMLGAWLACYIMERLIGKSPRQAMRAAYGSMLGRFLGMTVKIGLGAMIILLTMRWLWSEQIDLPSNLPLPEGEVIHVKRL